MELLICTKHKKFKGIGGGGVGIKVSDFSSNNILWYLDYKSAKIFLQNLKIFNSRWFMTGRSWQLRAWFSGFIWKKSPKIWLFRIFGNTFLCTNSSENLYFWFLGEIWWISSDIQSRIFDFFVVGDCWPILGQNLPENH